MEVNKEIKKNLLSENIFKILISPIVTEKTNVLLKKKQITFRVKSKSNKTEIKEAFEKIFKVKVKDVSICNVHSKLKNRGGRKGKISGYKKAIVTLHKNDNLDFFENNK